MTLDPIQLTRRLIDIESITYNEGAVGAYLADFLAGRNFAVECTPVAPPEGPCGPAGPVAPVVPCGPVAPVAPVEPVGPGVLSFLQAAAPSRQTNAIGSKSLVVFMTNE